MGLLSPRDKLFDDPIADGRLGLYEADEISISHRRITCTNMCQCRLKFPQLRRSKNPQLGGCSVISRLDGDRWLRFWVADRDGATAVPGLAS